MTLTIRDVRWVADRTVIVDGVSLSVESGQILGLIGPNGSGKSSLLRVMAGLRPPAAGAVFVDDTPMTSLSRRDLSREIAVVEQHSQTDAHITVLDIVRLGRTPYRSAFSGWTQEDEMLVQEALLRTGLWEKRGQIWHTLSGGERQRVQLARALAQAPKVLILDEPTNHLDIQHQIEILRLIAELPVTVIMAIHDLNLAARFCDRIAVMKEGRLAGWGEPQEVLTASLLLDVFGVTAEVTASKTHGRPHLTFLM